MEYGSGWSAWDLKHKTRVPWSCREVEVLSVHVVGAKRRAAPGRMSNGRSKYKVRMEDGQRLPCD